MISRAKISMFFSFATSFMICSNRILMSPTNTFFLRFGHQIRWKFIRNTLFLECLYCIFYLQQCSFYVYSYLLPILRGSLSPRLKPGACAHPLTPRFVIASLSHTHQTSFSEWYPGMCQTPELRSFDHSGHRSK